MLTNRNLSIKVKYLQMNKYSILLIINNKISLCLLQIQKNKNNKKNNKKINNLLYKFNRFPKRNKIRYRTKLNKKNKNKNSQLILPQNIKSMLLFKWDFKDRKLSKHYLLPRITHSLLSTTCLMGCLRKIPKIRIQLLTTIHLSNNLKIIQQYKG